MKKKDIVKTESREVEMPQDLPVFTPVADIYEKEDSILVICDMPGVKDEQVDVVLDNGELTITGYQDIAEPEGHEITHRGYESGIFRRVFLLANEINTEKIEAKISNGVLNVLLPKLEQAQPKKITVKAA